MPDETFDAVIVGGGTTALYTAMYLMRYGGMSVGIFERRHEIGGCMATEEACAPGFRGNTHATMSFPWYHLPIYRDFPEFWEYGGQRDQYLVADGGSFIKEETCLAIYSTKDESIVRKMTPHRSVPRRRLPASRKEMVSGGSNSGTCGRVIKHRIVR